MLLRNLVDTIHSGIVQSILERMLGQIVRRRPLDRDWRTSECHKPFCLHCTLQHSIRNKHTLQKHALSALQRACCTVGRSLTSFWCTLDMKTSCVYATHYTHIQIGSSRMNYSEKLSFALLDFDASVTTTTYYNTSTGPHHPHPYYLMYTIPYLPLISSEGWIFYFKTLHMVCKRMPQNLGSPLRMKNPYPLFSFYSLHTLHWRVDKFSLIW